MSGPTGLIFAMRSRYTNQSGTEAFYDEANTAFSGQDAGFDSAIDQDFSDPVAGVGTTSQTGSNPALLNPTGTASSTGYDVGQGMPTGSAEALKGTGTDAYNHKPFSI